VADEFAGPTWSTPPSAGAALDRANGHSGRSRTVAAIAATYSNTKRFVRNAPNGQNWSALRTLSVRSGVSRTTERPVRHFHSKRIKPTM